ncbi:MAG TPA: DUF2505 family protein [Polyangia bacterium]|nr:DUF2505 family protein [Polyangia bacterium]
MRFELKHTFDAPIDAVLAAMFDPGLFDHLKKNMSTIHDIQPIERTEDEGTIRRRTRYTPVPLIKRVGPKQVPPGAMAFIEDSRLDKRARRLEFENIPDLATLRKLLVNKGTISFRDLGGGRTERTVAGELTVKVFLLGKIAERLIYGEAEKILNEEARALAGFLTVRKAGGE